jgi:Carboxypeptidase regulatory-like domain
MRLLLTSLLLPALSLAQSVSGTVFDASHSALPAAAVNIRNVETGTARSTITDSSGRFAAVGLAIGAYTLTASKDGFSSLTKTGITLALGEDATVNLTLSVDQFKQTVSVQEDVPVIAVSTAQTSGLVGEREVKELPLNGRSYDELITLNPGIVNYTAQRSGGVGTSNSAVGNMFAVSGRRPQENLFLLNGIEYTSASEINLTPGGASGQLLGVDAVREFNVVTDAYGAEFGKKPGGQVTIATANGTNQFHGSLFEFLRNSALDARNFFDQASVPQFQRNEFGGAVGGPIKKDRTFFFGNYEGFRQHLGLSDVTLVPDNAARNGPLAPGVAPLLTLWPVQNGPELGGEIAEAFSSPLQTIREDFGTLRLDHNFSSKDSLFGVYTVDDSADLTPTANPISQYVETLREQVISLQETHVFSPNLINSARFGFSRGSYFFNSDTTVSVPGWIEGQPIGALVIGGSTASNAASQLSNAGNNAGSNLRAARNLFTYEDHINLTRGKHQIEAGVWFQRIQANDSFAQAQFGQASFATLPALLQGTVATFTAVPSPTPLGWRSLEAAAYVQDTIHLRPNLEIKLGFRSESTNGWNEVAGRAANYGFTNGVINSNPTIGSSVFTNNNAKFLPAPRVGIAWDPFGGGNTVIRAGFGIYYSLLDNLSFRLDQNAPYNTTISLKNVAVGSIDIVPGQPLPAGGKISPAGVDPNLKTGAVESYTLKVEQKIAPNTTLSVGYVGSHGYHEILAVDANEPLPTANLTYPTGAPLANPNLANTTSWFSEGNSSYNALQLDVQHRFSHNFQLRAVYTWSKSLDDGATLNSSVATNAPGFVMYPGNPRIDWSLSTFNVTGLGVINGVYQLPKGWSLAGVATFQSGLPFTAQLGYNPSNNGDSRNPVRPSYNPAFTGPIILGGPNQYFNPNAFTTPANGTYGNVGRDTLIGPGIATLDASLLKVLPISERIKLQFRAEFFNALNRANFNTPNPLVFGSAGSLPLSTAGVITSTSTTSRQIQFGVKLLW